MMDLKIASVVEGHGECAAVPILVRRIAHDIDPGLVPVLLHPLRVPASRLRKQDELERAVEFSARKLQGVGGVIILLDCDWEDGCPAREGPALLARAKSVRPQLPISVILAKKEYEAWFLAAAESLRGKRKLPNDLKPPAAPEAIRGAKEWLSERMPDGSTYSETEDQPALTAVFDMMLARRADSFDK
ncbi:MAG: hypothetical protein C0404_14655 [Verrucomicrobia bacterium]|nr:hypothetical protein [Verrucomicrobiota bacterium]